MQSGIFGVPGLLTQPKFVFWSGYQNGIWTSNTSMGDGTNSGGNTLVTRVSRGLDVVASSDSTVPAGITFKPAGPGSVYFVSVTTYIGSNGSGGITNLQLTDGTVIISTASNQNGNFTGTNIVPATMWGVYVCVSPGPITLKVQIQNTGGPSSAMEVPSSPSNTLEWSIIQIA